MKGKLYGVGVGPGDPELLTLKALRLMREADIIAVPGEAAKESVAYKIAEGAYPDIKNKCLMAVSMPMLREKTLLDAAHDKAASLIKAELNQGKKVVFLTLGDPTVYSTYLYIHKRIRHEGYETEIVSGIPSFCAAAARINIGLVENNEPLHVIPASWQTEGALELHGTKVFMKAGKKISDVKRKIIERDSEAVMVENCGMKDEKIYRNAEDIPDNAGYYSLIIIKESEKEGEER